jgi:hypothetical protein
VKYAPILLMLIATPCWAQATATGKADSAGPCSPAVSGNNNTFTINCGISHKQGQQMLNILNKVLANQIDPEAVMAKLDEIQNDIRHIQSRQGWPELTADQAKILTGKLGMFPKQKVSIVVTNQDNNKWLVAGQLRDAFQSAKWDATLGTNMWMGEPVRGIYVGVKADTLATRSLIYGLRDIFGKEAVIYTGVSDKLADVDITVGIYDSLKP